MDADVTDIIHLKEENKLVGLDDFDNAIAMPVEREAIAVRPVFHELNALLEWELQVCAHDAYLNSPKHAKHRKTLLDVSSLDQISKLKSVSDLKFGEIVELVESHYGIQFLDLPGYREVQSMRETVNAFKHRKGFKDIRKDKDLRWDKPLNLTELFQPKRDDAYTAIKDTRIFLIALWGKIKSPKS